MERYNALTVQQGTNGIYRVIIFFCEVKPTNLVFKVCKRRKKQVSHLAMVISDLPRVGKTKYILT